MDRLSIQQSVGDILSGYYAQVHMHLKRPIERRLHQRLIKFDSAAAVVKQLPGVYQFAKNLQNNYGVKIYKLFCLIFKTLYTFQHRPIASDS